MMTYFLVMVVVGNFSVAPTAPMPSFPTLRACQIVGIAWVNAADQLKDRASYVCVPYERPKPKAKRRPRPGGLQ